MTRLQRPNKRKSYAVRHLEAADCSLPGTQNMYQLSAICRHERSGLTDTLILLESLSCSNACRSKLKLRTEIMRTDCSEMNQLVQVQWHYLCVCVCLSVCTFTHSLRACCLCVKNSGRRGGMSWQVVLWSTRPLCCSVTYLSSLTCSSGSTRATWSARDTQLIGPLLVYQVSPGQSV